MNINNIKNLGNINNEDVLVKKLKQAIPNPYHGQMVPIIYNQDHIILWRNNQGFIHFHHIRLSDKTHTGKYRINSKNQIVKTESAVYSNDNLKNIIKMIKQERSI